MAACHYANGEWGILKSNNDFWKSDHHWVGWKINFQVAAIEVDMKMEEKICPEFKEWLAPNCLFWKVMSRFKEQLASHKKNKTN